MDFTAPHGDAGVVARLGSLEGRSDQDCSVATTGSDGGARQDSGLDTMIDRLDALGGIFTIDTTPGTRTILTGRLPLRPAEVPA
jgi:hypothetical protein